MRTVLVLGGYGFFGLRISAALAARPALRVLIAGRDRGRALRATRSLRLPDPCALAIDAGAADLARTLSELQVDLLIHAAGPFQGQAYAVARAAIDAGCHYIDLADGRRFVAGIEALAPLAAARGVMVVSGASSVPALSSAVVERFRHRFEVLESIHIGISSGARAPGLATVQGVFSYAGKPFQVWHDGSWVERYGWQRLCRHEFPPPLGKRWLADCDVPDLELFPRRYPTVRSVSFQAGFAGDFGHLAVWGLGRLVRAGALGDLGALAAPLNRLSRWLEPLTSDQGGMFVRLGGRGVGGAPLGITWNLLARQNHGAHIPCGAAIALATKFAADAALPSGAMPCLGLLTVEEFLAPLRALDIREVVA